MNTIPEMNKFKHSTIISRNTILTTSSILFIALLIGFTACKKKKETVTPATPKTLNKTALTNNVTWYNQGGSILHIFKPNGTYGYTGTWNWVGNSDTMEIVMIAGDPKIKWKFNWNTETEMGCEWITNGGERLFKTTAW